MTQIIELKYKINDFRLVERLFQIETACFESSVGWGRAGIERVLRGLNNRLVVAMDDDGLIQGYCLFSVALQHHSIHIKCIAVNPEAQRRGFAFMMLQKARQIASENQPKPCSITLECRPANEEYYKNIGFRVVKEPQANYYSVGQYRLPGVSMEAQHLFRHESGKKVENKFVENSDVAQLIDFVKEVKGSTSWWYRGFGHSARKEKAFSAIYLELLTYQEANKQLTAIQYERILRAIVSNALVVRSQYRSGTSRTRSINKVLSCLQSPEFEQLKRIISPKQDELSFDQLVSFSGYEKDTNRHSQAAPQYPYCHFFKRSSLEIKITSNLQPLLR